jgi:hypothetical protein
MTNDRHLQGIIMIWLVMPPRPWQKTHTNCFHIHRRWKKKGYDIHTAKHRTKVGLKYLRSRILTRIFNYYFWHSCRLSTPVFCPQSRWQGHLRQCADTTLNFYSSFVAFSSAAPLSPSLYSPWIQSTPHCLIKVRIESIIRCKWKFKK